MKVVLLVGSLEEGKGVARIAGLAMRDVVIPRSGQAFLRWKLEDGDLIFEFPSWQNVEAETRRKIEATLRAQMSRCSDVAWESRT